ncbi:hypothetical protein RI054_20g90090 [Pseudoscourfieldia marina]
MVLAIPPYLLVTISIPCLVQVAVHVEDVDEFRRVTDDRVIKDRHAPLITLPYKSFDVFTTIVARLAADALFTSAMRKFAFSPEPPSPSTAPFENVSVIA